MIKVRIKVESSKLIRWWFDGKEEEPFYSKEEVERWLYGNGCEKNGKLFTWGTPIEGTWYAVGENENA